MGEMADMALDRAWHEEEQLDQYCSGEMSLEDAYAYGLIDETGTEQEGVQAGWDRYELPTVDNLANALNHAEKDLDLSICSKVCINKTQLNQQAIINLSKKNPTCNVCNEEMTARIGKFGKFYYCMNQCPEQKCVSDKYWQSVRSN